MLQKHSSVPWEKKVGKSFKEHSQPAELFVLSNSNFNLVRCLAILLSCNIQYGTGPKAPQG